MLQTRARGGDDIWKKIGDKFSEIENNCGKDYPEIYFNLPGNYYQLTGYGKCLWDAIEKYYSTGNIYQKSEKWGGTAFHAIIVTFSVVKVGTLTTAITHFDPIYLTLSTTLKIVKPLIVNGIKVFRCGTKFVTFTGENNTFVLRFIESKGEAFTGDWQQAIRWVEVTDKAGNKYRVGLIGDDLPIRNSPEFSNFDIVRNPDGTPIQVEGQRFLAEISDGQEGHLAVVERFAKGAGKFTTKQIDDYVALATQNKDATKVMLGKYLDGGPNSYIQRAGTDYTYFDMGSVKWKEAEALVGKNADEMWKINKQFIDNQKALNKEFYFSQEPWKAQTHEYLSKEAEYLIDLGAKDFQKINENTWKVIW